MRNAGPETCRIDPHVTRLLREAQEWRLLGRLLERPRKGWHDDVRRLTQGTIDDAVRDAANLARDATEGEYLGVFGPSGVVSPRAVAHCGLLDPGQMLADLEFRYRAFGFVPAAEDPSDHISVEAGFVGYLRLKEAYARARQADDPAEITAAASARFLADHLRQMAEPVAACLAGAAPPYLARTGRLLADRVGAPPTIGSRPVIWLTDESWDCGLRE